MPIGKQIAFYRKKKKLTQEQFADSIEVKKISISSIEQCARFPSNDLLQKIAVALDCDVQLNLIPQTKVIGR